MRATSPRFRHLLLQSASRRKRRTRRGPSLARNGGGRGTGAGRRAARRGARPGTEAGGRGEEERAGGCPGIAGGRCGGRERRSQRRGSGSTEIGKGAAQETHDEKRAAPRPLGNARFGPPHAAAHERPQDAAPSVVPGTSLALPPGVPRGRIESRTPAPMPAGHQSRRAPRQSGRAFAPCTGARSFPACLRRPLVAASRRRRRPCPSQSSLDARHSWNEDGHAVKGKLARSSE